MPCGKERSNCSSTSPSSTSATTCSFLTWPAGVENACPRSLMCLSSPSRPTGSARSLSRRRARSTECARCPHLRPREGRPRLLARPDRQVLSPPGATLGVVAAHEAVRRSRRSPSTPSTSTWEGSGWRRFDARHEYCANEQNCLPHTVLSLIRCSARIVMKSHAEPTAKLARWMHAPIQIPSITSRTTTGTTSDG